MTLTMRSRCRALALLSLLTLCCGSGCWLRSQPTSHAIGIGWTSPGGIPGIDRGAISRIALSDGPTTVTIVVWSDLGLGGSRSSSSARGAIDQQSHEGNGRRLDFVARLMKRSGAEFEMAGKTYDLSKGTLFLVSSKSTIPVVSQLPLPVATELPKDVSEAKKFIAEHPELANFFEKQAAEPAP